MNWQMTSITFAFMLLGYLIGSILSSVWVLKLFKLKDMSTQGSKNPGATNVVRIYGKTMGFVVFMCDFLKPIMSVMIAYLSFSYEKMIMQLVALAVVLGHIFPVFHWFKGGKGAACMFGTIAIINWLLFLILVIIFLIIALIFKKSSLGSMIGAPMTLFFYLVLSQMDGFNMKIFEPITYQYPYWINALTFLIIILVVIWAHHDNIMKLINKEKYDYKW